MNDEEFIQKFKSHIDMLSNDERLLFSIEICKQLFFDYHRFVEVHKWGNSDLLMDAIKMCESGSHGMVELSQLRSMLKKVDAITPDTERFGDEISSCALNAATAIGETLVFMINHNKDHIYTTGMCYVDMAFFKIIQEDGMIGYDEIQEHPSMIEAKKYILNLRPKK